MVHSLDLRLGPITHSLLVRDAKIKEQLAHGVLESQNERLDVSVMDAKERQDADVTGLLQAWRGGDIDARDRLATVVYQELRRRAVAYLRRERVGHTLQPTALVHEVFLLLVKQDRTAWQNRGQFFGVASQMMRRILVDRARARNTAKRSGRWAQVTLDEDVAHAPARAVDTAEREWQVARGWLYARLNQKPGKSRID